MHRNEKSTWQRDHEWRQAKNRGAHDLGKADMTLRQTVMEKMTSLHDEESDVGVSWCDHFFRIVMLLPIVVMRTRFAPEPLRPVAVCTA